MAGKADNGDEKLFPILSAEEAEALPPPDEEEYRRGYYDGFVEALNALDDLMSPGKLSADEAHRLLWKHWDEGALYHWRWNFDDNGDQMPTWDYIYPPQYPAPDKHG